MERTSILDELSYNRVTLERKRLASRIGMEPYKLSASLQEVSIDMENLYLEVSTEELNIDTVYEEVYSDLQTLTLRANSIIKRIEAIVRSTNNE